MEAVRWRLDDRPPTPARECVRRGLRLVGPGNLLREVRDRRRRADMIDLVTCDASADPVPGPDGAALHPPVWGGGTSLTWHAACAAAIGEAIERASGYRWDPSALHTAPAARLGGRAVDLASFALFSATQYATAGFPFRPFRPDEEIPWVRGWSFTRGEPVFVPGEMVYLHPALHCGSHLIATSNGMACGLALEEALCSAAYELIERDAVMIAWLARRAVPSIALASFSDAGVDAVAARIRRARVAARLLDVTTDVGVPTYLAMVEALDGERPAVAFGAAARMSPRRAALKALVEAAQCWNWLREPVASRIVDPTPGDLRSLETRTFEEHGLLYAEPWTKPHLDVLLSGPARPNARPDPAPFDTPRAELEAVRRAIERLGYELSAVDVSPPELAPTGFRVVRAVVPELVPLSLSEPRVYKGSPRYYDVPRRLGDPDPVRTEHELNGDPHPFP